MIAGSGTDASGTLVMDPLVRSMADRAQMEVVRPHDEGGSDSPGTDASAPWHEADDARVLELLLALVSEGPPSDELPARALDRVVELLGLSGATLSLVFEHDDTLQLEPVASVGAHAAFARDMSARPLETLADVATAVAEGTPVFVVDSHGPATTPASKTGVGRWRSTISAHATGVLPVRAWGRTLGVLTVEWPGSRPLETRERKLLESVAGVLGVMLDRMERTASLAAEDELDAVESATDTEFVYGVTAEGVVVPLSGGAAEGLETALTVSVAARTAPSEEAPIRDVVSFGPRSLACVVGVAASQGGDPEAAADSAAATLRTYASQRVSPADALVYLGHALRATGPEDSRVSVLACSADLSGAAIRITFSTAGAVLSALCSPGGRLEVRLSDRPALGRASVKPAAERHMLLLPGDAVVFASGQVAPMDTAEGRATLRRALEEARGDGMKAARAILGGFPEGNRAAAVAVIEVTERPEAT